MTQFIQLQKRGGECFFVQVSSIDMIMPADLKEDRPKCFLIVGGRKWDLEDNYLDVMDRISVYALFNTGPSKTEQFKVKK